MLATNDPLLWQGALKACGRVRLSVTFSDEVTFNLWVICEPLAESFQA